MPRSDPEHPYLICHLALHSADGTRALDPVSPSNSQFPPDRLLYGNLVSSPHYLRNLQGRSGVYFLFPDVSVRRQGQYVLQLTLMRLSRYAFAILGRMWRSSNLSALWKSGRIRYGACRRERLRLGAGTHAALRRAAAPHVCRPA